MLFVECRFIALNEKNYRYLGNFINDVELRIIDVD